MTTTDKLESVELERIELHPMNRKRLGDMKELQADIEMNGIEVPLIGRWLTTMEAREFYPKRQGDAPAFQVLAGARRLTVARNLKLVAINVLSRELDDEEAFRFLMRENLHRENVHPLDEALYFEQCIQQGADVEMIAAELGKQAAYVHKRLQLTQLIPTLRTMYEKGTFGAGVAMELARIPDAAQKEAVAWVRDRARFGDVLTVKSVRSWVEHNHTLILSAACFSPKDAELWPAAGSCVECPKRTGGTPSLFADLTDKDSCTDKACWEQKCLKRIEQRIAEFKEQGVEWCPLGGYGYIPNAAKTYDGKAILDGNQWQECKQKEKGAFRGIVVRPDRGLSELGKSIWAKMYAPTRHTSPSGDAHWKAEQAKRARLDKINSHHRTLVFDAIREAPPLVKGHSGAAVTSFMQRVAIAFWKRLWHESQKKIAKSYGWEPVKQKQYSGWDMDRTGRERILVMKPAELMKFLELLTVGESLALQGTGNKDELLTYAKEIDIDVAALKRQAVKKFPPKKVAKKKATTRKKARAKRARA
jgi:ParB family chromosome partitioning protein